MNVDQLFSDYGNYILTLKNATTLKALEIKIPKHWVVNIITEPFTLKKVDDGHYFLIAPKGTEQPEITFQSLINKFIALVEFNTMLEKKQNEFKQMIKSIEDKFQSEIDGLINKYSSLDEQVGEEDSQLESDDELESEELDMENNEK